MFFIGRGSGLGLEPASSAYYVSQHTFSDALHDYRSVCARNLPANGLSVLCIFATRALAVSSSANYAAGHGWIMVMVMAHTLLEVSHV